MIDLRQGDCLEIMSHLNDKSVDMILCDLPYGTLAHKWDEIIDFNKLWAEYTRIIRDNGAIVLFATQPFTSKLISSNYDLYRYSWVWVKDGGTNYLNVNYMPLKNTEDICVFSKGKVGSLAKNPIRYFPQDIVEVNIEKCNNPNSKFRESMGYGGKNNQVNSNTKYTQKYTNYPKQILEFKRESGYHPTQKPVPLLEYLIKTYTNEGDLVLDNCMGSGSTGVACKNLNRNFIGIELDENYFNTAKERIKNA